MHSLRNAAQDAAAGSAAQGDAKSEGNEYERQQIADQNDRCDFARLLTELFGNHEVEHRRRQAAEQDQQPFLHRIGINQHDEERCDTKTGQWANDASNDADLPVAEACVSEAGAKAFRDGHTGVMLNTGLKPSDVPKETRILLPR